MTTTPTKIDGNITDIDSAAKYFTLEDRQGKPFVKVFWKPQHEDIMRKQRVGYYEAPVVEMEEAGGGLREAVLVDMPAYTPRPDDFPRPARKKGSGGNWQPRNEALIVYQTVYKECAETARSHLLQLSEPFDEAECDRAMDWAIERAKKDAKALIDAARQ